MTRPNMNSPEWDKMMEEIVNEAKASGLFEGLEPADFEFAAQVAKAEILGELNKTQVRQILDNWQKNKPGRFKSFTDGHELVDADLPDTQEQWDEITADWIDVTDKVQAALCEAGYAGFADGLIKVSIAPVQTELDTPCMALMGKPWFDVERLTDEEREVIYRAVYLSAESEGVKWLPKE
jgi:hypothetical protein